MLKKYNKSQNLKKVVLNKNHNHTQKVPANLEVAVIK